MQELCDAIYSKHVAVVVCACACAYKRSAMAEGTLCRVFELKPGDRDEPLQIPTTEAVKRPSNKLNYVLKEVNESVACTLQKQGRNILVYSTSNIRVLACHGSCSSQSS